MTNPLTRLEHDLEVLRASWAGALPAFAVVDDTAPSDAAAMSDTGLVQVVTALVRLRRDAESLLAQAAAEVGRRSDSSFGGEGLARQQGFRNTVQFLAATTGATTTDAAKLIRAGEASRPRQSFAGEPLPAKHPFVAAALHGGSISVDAADVICGMLDRVALRADGERARHYEAELAQFAAGVPLSLLARPSSSPRRGSIPTASSRATRCSAPSGRSSSTKSRRAWCGCTPGSTR